MPQVSLVKHSPNYASVVQVDPSGPSGSQVERAQVRSVEVTIFQIWRRHALTTVAVPVALQFRNALHSCKSVHVLTLLAPPDDR